MTRWWYPKDFNVTPHDDDSPSSFKKGGVHANSRASVPVLQEPTFSHLLWENAVAKGAAWIFLGGKPGQGHKEKQTRKTLKPKSLGTCNIRGTRKTLKPKSLETCDIARCPPHFIEPSFSEQLPYCIHCRRNVHQSPERHQNPEAIFLKQASLRIYASTCMAFARSKASLEETGSKVAALFS